MASVITLDGRRSPVKGWKKAKPRKVSQRRRVADKCGAERCFLRPSNLGYPICSTRSGCKPDCRGLLAAYSRAKANKAYRISAKARRIAKHQGCSWAKGK